MEGNKKRLSRRDFFRLAGIGIGSAAVVSAAKPMANPSDFKGGTFSDPAGRPNRPWWVKTVDEPTTEIDWDVMERYNERTGTVRGPGMAGYVGDDEVDRLSDVAKQNEKQRMLDDVDGYTLKDQALKSSHVGVGRSFLGPQKAKTPEDRGVPKWEGSPEEAARIIRAAMRHMGASSVGFMELDDNTRKLVYGVDPDGKDVIFTDDPIAEETEDARMVPNAAKYVIVYTVQMSTETMRRAPTPLASQTTTLAYKRGETIQASLQEFLRGLGYQCLAESSTNALGIAPAMAVMAGLGEMSRLNRLITPEFGPMVRVFKAFTDLPVAVDKPIDAGIMEFCKRCKKCAEACPSESLSFEDEPTWETRGGWNNPGHKAYFEDAVTCRAFWREQAGTNCGICFAVCPFTKKDKAWVHEWVKAGASTAPVLDSFFRSMDDAFGYGTQANSEEWWSLDLPEYGIDSNQPVMEA
ncbi:MAG: reductive dehalogenase [Chloroflexi bacterium]|nr:MAG: reductive dehalogenase [Chloroflexota bacterium]MBL1195449.1 reductive dehalogenase [Chloroflexota bacterium]NOH12732.1 reductive dehalogenase [Chloroflexota bacterium]